MCLLGSSNSLKECVTARRIPTPAYFAGVFFTQHFPSQYPQKLLLRILANLNLLGYSGTTMTVRMRHTRSHTKNRRSHHALTAINLGVDKESGSTHLRHHVDMKTGMYKGRKVIDVVKKVEKKLSKAKN